MDIRPILSTLRKHRTASALIILEIALTCAIICNAFFLISQRIDRVNTQTGMVDNELVRIRMTGSEVIRDNATDSNAPKKFPDDVQTQEDLALLKAIPGVKSVTITNQLPFHNSTWNSGITLAPDQEKDSISVGLYLTGKDFIKTLGLNVISGRDFNEQEYRPFAAFKSFDDIPPTALINKRMADSLFPNTEAVGKVIYMGKKPITIIGVVDTFVHPQLRPSNPYNIIVPLFMNYNNGGQYLIRTESNQRAEVLSASVAALKKANSKRIILDQNTIEEMRNKFFQQDRAMAWLLVSVSIALLIVTALGIVGLVSFWVQQRTRMIGIRRALGATKGQILRYFQIENLILASAGIILGMILAYGINFSLMKYYELPRLPLIYLPVGAVLLWLLGQVAVYIPARNASALSPATAARS